MQVIYKNFMENIKKLKNFYSTILNPVTVGKIILDVNGVIQMKNPTVKPVTSYSELKYIL